MDKYYTLFTKESNTKTMTNSQDKVCTFETASMKIPQLVSRMWTTRLVGELPAVTVAKKNLEETFQKDFMRELDKPINALMGIGQIYVIPFLSAKDELKFDFVNENEHKVESVSEGDELVYLKYEFKEKLYINDEVSEEVVYYVHRLKEGVYYHQRYYQKEEIKVYLDGMDGTKKIADTFMLPFKIDLTINFDKIGYPIWSNAYYQIKDVDNTYTEMLDVMERLSPVVGIPRDHTSEREDGTTVLGSDSRLFQLIKGINDETEWKYFGGGFDPKPFIEAMDFILNNVSEHCGLGHRRLSYDQVKGTVKTATEVTFSQNDLMINQSLINQTIEYLIKRLTKSFYYIKNAKWLTDDDIEVVFEDAVFNTKEEYIKQLQYDVAMGNINKEFYLEEVYKDKDIEKIIGSGEDGTTF